MCRYAEKLRLQDLVYVIAVARASHIPQMCPNKFSQPGIIFELMEKANSEMLIYDPSLEHLTANCPFPKLAFKPIESIEKCSTVHTDSALPKIEDLSTGSDVGFVFLTSGSTSGSPKLVPLTHKILSIFHKVRYRRLLDGKRGDTQDVLLARDNICHLPSTLGAPSGYLFLPFCDETM